MRSWCHLRKCVHPSSGSTAERQDDATLDMPLNPGSLENPLEATQGVAHNTTGVGNFRGLLNHSLAATSRVGLRTLGSLAGPLEEESGFAYCTQACRLER